MKKTVKMKKVVLSLAIAASLCAALPLTASAATASNPSVSQSNALKLISETVEYFPDGSYMTTTIYESPILNRGNVYATEGRKVISYNNGNGSLAWDYTLSATFSVNAGVSATCKTASGTPSISDNSWSVVSNSPTASGNKATGKITMQKKVAGSPTQKVSKTVTLTCDRNGKLS